MDQTADLGSVDLYRLPLEAGGSSVRTNGKVIEAFSAALARRESKALFHSALMVHHDERTWAIEQTPAGHCDGGEHSSVGKRTHAYARVGRDELRAGGMWNYNSVVAWLLERAGLDASAVDPPPGGRAPGWS